MTRTALTRLGKSRGEPEESEVELVMTVGAAALDVIRAQRGRVTHGDE